MEMNRREFLKMLGNVTKAGLAGVVLLPMRSCRLGTSIDNITQENRPFYLVINADSLHEHAQELVELRKQDYSIDHIKISEISISPTPDSIKGFLREYIADKNPKYIVLIGDVTTIPTDYTYQRDIRVPTDFYYSNLVTQDENLADIALGRIPCNNGDDLHTIIKKIVNFETRQIDEVLLFGDGLELSVYGKSHEEFLISKGHKPIFVDETRNLEQALADVIGHLSEADVAVHYGHGTRTSFHPFSSSSLSNLPDNDFILLSGGCESMNFTNLEPDICIGYAFLKSPNGSVASIGNSRRGGYGYMYSFIEGFLGAPATTIGEMVLNGMKHQKTQHDSAISRQEELGTSSVELSNFNAILALLGDPATKVNLT